MAFEDTPGQFDDALRKTDTLQSPQDLGMSSHDSLVVCWNPLDEVMCSPEIFDRCGSKKLKTWSASPNADRLAWFPHSSKASPRDRRQIVMKSQMVENWRGRIYQLVVGWCSHISHFCR